MHIKENLLEKECKNSDFVVAVYQNLTTKISDIKSRHWSFLLALSASQGFYISQINVKCSSLNYLLAIHLIIAFVISIALHQGISALYKERAKLKLINQILLSDCRLKKIVNKNPEAKDCGDCLMEIIGYITPAASIVLSIYIS